ncbi:MAG: glutaredoxin family protein [Tissierellales bacterium]|nr:glutaredoxin family protein [Tissierellales bacterium]MBN2827342.1 glutaredoxin family protein [Tissierellales bacterium]
MANVIVYSSNTCPHCVTAKDYLKSKGVDFTEKNVSTDLEARKELMGMGFMGVPIIMIDGQIVEGFNRAKIDELI